MMPMMLTIILDRDGVFFWFSSRLVGWSFSFLGTDMIWCAVSVGGDWEMDGWVDVVEGFCFCWVWDTVDVLRIRM